LQGVPAGCIQQAASARRRWRNALAEEEEEVGVETSFEELAKRAEDVEEDEDDIVLDLAPGDDKAEALIEKVIPPQANEFTCRNCFLVKHRSQLADKKKMFCRDCA
jgi:hypothetical protein